MVGVAVAAGRIIVASSSNGNGSHSRSSSSRRRRRRRSGEVVVVVVPGNTAELPRALGASANLAQLYFRVWFGVPLSVRRRNA